MPFALKPPSPIKKIAGLIWEELASNPYIIVLTLLCSAHLYATLALGAGVSPDSTTYIEGAINLVAGDGYTQQVAANKFSAIVHFPPLYSYSLALLMWAGVPVANAPALLNCFCFATCMMMLAYSIRRLTGSHLLVVASILWLFTSPSMFDVFRMAWSEPLFMVLILLGLGTAIQHLLAGGRLWIAFACILLSLAFICRFAGFTAIATAALLIAAFGEGRLWERGFRAFVFGAVASLPTLLWMAWRSSNNLAGRTLSWHPIGRVHIHQAAETVSSWIHVDLPLWLKALIAVFLAIGAVAACFRVRHGNRAQHLVFMTAILFSVIYAAFIGASITLVDFNTPLNNRILAPVLMVAIFAVILSLHSWSTSSELPFLGRLLPFSIVIVAVFFQTPELWQKWSDMRTQGEGYASARWQHSSLLNEAKNVPLELAIYSNMPDLIRQSTQRPTYGFPSPFDPIKNQENPHFPALIKQELERAKNSSSIIFFITSIARPHSISLETIFEQGGWTLYAAFDDGVLLVPPNASALKTLQECGVLQNINRSYGFWELPLHSVRLDTTRCEYQTNSDGSIEIRSNSHDPFFVWSAGRANIPIHGISVAINHELKESTWFELSLRDRDTGAITTRRQAVSPASSAQTHNFWFSFDNPQETDLIRFDPTDGLGSIKVESVFLHTPLYWAGHKDLQRKRPLTEYYGYLPALRPDISSWELLLGDQVFAVYHAETIMDGQRLKITSDNNDPFLIWARRDLALPVLGVSITVESEGVKPDAQIVQIFLRDPVTQALTDVHLSYQQEKRVHIWFNEGHALMTDLIRIDPMAGPGTSWISNIVVHTPNGPITSADLVRALQPPNP